MYRGMIAAAALTAFISVGCEEKREGPTEQATEAADKAASQGKDALEKAKEEAQGSANAAANKPNDAMANQAEAAKDNIEDIVAKAKDALDKNKFDEASTYVTQLENLKNQLPADGRAKVDAALAEVKRKIEEGKAKLMPSMK